MAKRKSYLVFTSSNKFIDKRPENDRKVYHPTISPLLLQSTSECPNLKVSQEYNKANVLGTPSSSSKVINYSPRKEITVSNKWEMDVKLTAEQSPSKLK